MPALAARAVVHTRRRRAHRSRDGETRGDPRAGDSHRRPARRARPAAARRPRRRADRPPADARWRPDGCGLMRPPRVEAQRDDALAAPRRIGSWTERPHPGPRGASCRARRPHVAEHGVRHLPDRHVDGALAVPEPALHQGAIVALDFAGTPRRRQQATGARAAREQHHAGRPAPQAMQRCRLRETTTDARQQGVHEEPTRRRRRQPGRLCHRDEVVVERQDCEGERHRGLRPGRAVPFEALARAQPGIGDRRRAIEAHLPRVDPTRPHRRVAVPVARGQVREHRPARGARVDPLAVDPAVVGLRHRRGRSSP